MPSNVLEDWVETNLQLVQLELAEEMRQAELLDQKYPTYELEKVGRALEKLEIGNCQTILNIIRRVKLSRGKKINLAVTEIHKGSLVDLCLNVSAGNINKQIEATIEEHNLRTRKLKNNRVIVYFNAVALEVKEKSIEVALQNDLEVLNTLRRLGKKQIDVIQRATSIPFERMMACLMSMPEMALSNPLIRQLFGMNKLYKAQTNWKPYQTVQLKKYTDFVWFNEKLNESQKEIIKFAFQQQHLAVVHGPPGTGKTTTLAELTLQLISRGLKVLITAHSNVAVDNLATQILSTTNLMRSRFGIRQPFNYVRLGNPARIDYQILRLSLDYRLSKNSQYNNARKRYRIAKRAIRLEGTTPEKEKQLKTLLKRMLEIKTRVQREILKSASVVMATLVGSSMDTVLRLINKGSELIWDVVIIDECAQANEAAAWIPLLFAKKCILAGDPYQLPPTVKTAEAKAGGFAISLMERLMNDPRFVNSIRMLKVQYRMNQLIMEWSSDFFYENLLVAHQSVANRRMVNNATNQTFPSIQLIDSKDCQMHELQERNQSLGNTHEVEIVYKYICQLTQSGVSPSWIGVITPYRLQRSLLMDRCAGFKDLEINSVDGFQGREKEVVIFSMVRSNLRGNAGFLSEERRLNVAITRARSHLVIICDSWTVRRAGVAADSFMDYCYDYGNVMSARDFIRPN